MIRITLERPGREGGRERVLVREFDDHYEAASWFIHDSYFEQPYTAKATWEVVHKYSCEVCKGLKVEKKSKGIGYVCDDCLPDYFEGSR
jgi:hypothetical protein